MAYVVVTHWETTSDDADAEAGWKRVQEQNIPALKALGAHSAMGVELSDTKAMMISVFPDKATFEAAHAKIQKLRQKTGAELNTKMTGEYKGELKAAG